MKPIYVCFIVFAVLITNCAFAQIEPVGKDHVAIGGYDVVAYFKINKAMKGRADLAANHNDVIYYFSNLENQNAFLKNPTDFLPQYDGYCALAVGAQNKKVSINPERFIITNNKLYLFFDGPLPLSAKKFNSLEPWIKDENNLIKKADVNWQTLKHTKKK